MSVLIFLLFYLVALAKSSCVNQEIEFLYNDDEVTSGGDAGELPTPHPNKFSVDAISATPTTENIFMSSRNSVDSLNGVKKALYELTPKLSREVNTG